LRSPVQFRPGPQFGGIAQRESIGVACQRREFDSPYLHHGQHEVCAIMVFLIVVF
jgi:hypothetical protein